MKLLFTLLLLLPLSVTAQSEEAITFEGYGGYVIRPVNPNGKWVWIMPAWLRGEGVMDNYIVAALNAQMTVVGLEIGTTLGSPIAADLNHRFFQDVTARYGLLRKAVLLLQSNGNTSGIAWATRHPKNVSKVFGIFPVMNLDDWPTEAWFSQLLNPAFAYPWASRVQPYNQLEPLARRGVPFLVIHGDADAVVHFKPNAVRAQRIYESFGGNFELIRVAGKGHEIAPEFHNNRAAKKFLVE